MSNIETFIKQILSHHMSQKINIVKNFSIDMVEPIIPEVPDSLRLRTYLRHLTCVTLYKSLGPNWEFHAEQEILDRSLDVFSKVMDPVVKTQTIARMIEENSGDFVLGDKLQNLGTLEALYSWSHERHVQSILALNPDWRLHTVNVNGVMVVDRVHSPESYSRGFDVAFLPIETRIRFWREAIEKIRSSPMSRCDECLSKFHNENGPPSPPILVRQNAERRRPCKEDVPLRCPDCSNIHIRYVSY